jgi:hypothetical protein
MARHYMTDCSDGKVSGCGKRAFQFAISTEFTTSPTNVRGCKKCEAAAKQEIQYRAKEES